MPYIKPITRKVLDPAIQLFFDEIKNIDWLHLKPGEMNNIVTKIVHWWILNNGLKYENLNAVIGFLECVKLELYRMVIAPYEDKKKAENGFISELDRITKDEKQAMWECKKCHTIFKTSEILDLFGCCANRNNWRQIRSELV